MATSGSFLTPLQPVLGRPEELNMRNYCELRNMTMKSHLSSHGFQHPLFLKTKDSRVDWHLQTHTKSFCLRSARQSVMGETILQVLFVFLLGFSTKEGQTLNKKDSEVNGSR